MGMTIRLLVERIHPCIQPVRGAPTIPSIGIRPASCDEKARDWCFTTNRYVGAQPRIAEKTIPKELYRRLKNQRSLFARTFRRAALRSALNPAVRASHCSPGTGL